MKDNYGKLSEISQTLACIRDTTPPIISNTTTNSTSATETTVSVGASDNISGIKSYKYYLGNVLKTTDTTSLNSSSKSVTGLTSGTNNTIKVEVTDNAGNISTSTLTNVPTKLFVWDYYGVIITNTYTDKVASRPSKNATICCYNNVGSDNPVYCYNHQGRR